MSRRLLALIPARGGSKRFPRKNMALLGGKPLLAWTIEAALASGVAEKVLLSTDDPEMAEIGRAYGAEVPFLRPAHLATDQVRNYQVMEHAVSWLASEQGYTTDMLGLLQPTSPLRNAEDIRGALELALASGASVESVTPLGWPPHWLRRLDEAGALEDPGFSKEKALFRLNGAIYLRCEAAPSERTVGYVMPPERSADIDTSEDLAYAAFLLRRQNSSTAAGDLASSPRV